MAEQVLYIGIDLGTFRSVMVSSDSHEEEELTVIGTPKDPIARNFLKRDVLFGEEALKNRLALNLFRPLELGVIKDTQEDREFIAHFITTLSVYPTLKNTTEWSPSSVHLQKHPMWTRPQSSTQLLAPSTLQ